MLDVVIRGGSIVDWTGAAPYTADVGVLDGVVIEIGAVTGGAREVIETDGAFVTPGLVDVHTHYDGRAT
jgi:N-acyl-D-amino-acid deacylase